MARQKRNSAVLKRAKRRLESLASIDKNLDFGAGLTVRDWGWEVVMVKPVKNTKWPVANDAKVGLRLNPLPQFLPQPPRSRVSHPAMGLPNPPLSRDTVPPCPGNPRRINYSQGVWVAQAFQLFWRQLVLQLKRPNPVENPLVVPRGTNRLRVSGNRVHPID
ncbi:MAG: hypothetical protein ACKO24_13675 [Leptolyngbyaceae cyanobacterium]